MTSEIRILRKLGHHLRESERFDEAVTAYRRLPELDHEECELHDRSVVLTLLVTCAFCPPVEARAFGSDADPQESAP
ncbi:MAG TPA: hypothetical protein VGP70_06155 [Actinomadura sp.]|nr:hypothetical protein [Actinomadura sp.]